MERFLCAEKLERRLLEKEDPGSFSLPGICFETWLEQIRTAERVVYFRSVELGWSLVNRLACGTHRHVSKFVQEAALNASTACVH